VWVLPSPYLHTHVINDIEEFDDDDEDDSRDDNHLITDGAMEDYHSSSPSVGQAVFQLQEEYYYIPKETVM
jgi:hypothetical protein